MADAYTFLPWVRQGLASAIVQVDPLDENLPSRVKDIQIQVTAKAGATAASAPPPTALRLFGPGDVTGIDPRQIINTDPKPLTPDFPPNYFPAIEFDRTDLPWLLTPAAANTTTNRLRPWICLIVVEKQGDEQLKTDTNKPLPVLYIENPQAELPDLAESWAWAHAQVVGLGAPESPETKRKLNAADSLAYVLEKTPDRNLSRLLCPRKLLPNKTYLACVVPTFEVGRKAGLGIEVKDGAGDDDEKLKPAWDSAKSDPVELPVYHHWEFSTGAEGDFEKLVWQLQRRRDLPPEVGVRQIQVHLHDPAETAPPWPTSDDLPLKELPVEGALRPYRDGDPDPVHELKKDPGYGRFQEQLRTLLNAEVLPVDRSELPLGLPIAPPIYGRWHAAERCIPPALGPDSNCKRNVTWLHDLNLNPTHRVAAALGTQIIQERQDQLMDSAWKQLGEIERANQALRQAQLARSASTILYEQRLKNLPAEDLLVITAAVHARVLGDPARLLVPADPAGAKTLSSVVGKSRVPDTSLQGPFRRLTSPRGPLARRLAAHGGLRASRIVDRLNQGYIDPVPPYRSPGGAVTMDEIKVRGLDLPGLCNVEDSLRDAILRQAPPPQALSQGLERGVRQPFKQFLSANPTLPADAQLPLGHAYDLLGACVGRASAASGEIWTSLRELRGVLVDLLTVRKELTRAATILAAQGLSGPADTVRSDIRAHLERVFPPGDIHWLLFALTAIEQQEDMTPCTVPAELVLPALVLPEIKALLLAKLEPRTTVVARLKARLVTPPGWQPEDPLEPIMAAPVFPIPMYKALKELSQDWLLPGLQHVPPNTVTALVTNPRFIEAFMVGLNHEMGRELLWRGFPTDQRGTYFRQFWDPRSRVPPPADLDAAADIEPIHEWTKIKDTALGDNLVQESPDDERVILLIRGELVQRYPDAIIYAARAAWAKDGAKNISPRSPVQLQNGAGGPEHDENRERYPIFRGTLPPDITFLGFNLPPKEARGIDDPDKDDPGWFFVLQQPPGEPHFGLDETAPAKPEETWNDLSWENVETTHATLDGIQDGYIRVKPKKDPAKKPSKPGKETSRADWDTDSAAMAYITMQFPFRVAIHASDLL